MSSSQKVLRAPIVTEISQDLSPVLSGDLDVNGKEIVGVIDLHSSGDIIAELGDAAGSNKLSIRDSGGVEVASIDSDGNINTIGTISGSHSAATLSTTTSPLDYLTLDEGTQAFTLNQVDLATDVSGTSDDITEGTTNKYNVQSDWNATSGLAEILNKPTDVTDLSTHSVTELNDVTSAGSGQIITAGERTTLGTALQPGSITLTTTSSPLDYLTLSGESFTLNQVDLSTDVTGTLPSGNIGSHSHTTGDITGFNTDVDARISLANLDDLADVTVPTPNDGEVLTYSASSPTGWISSAISGGDSLTWTFDNTTTAGGLADKNFRLDNATPAQVSEIYIDDNSTSGVDVGSIVDNLDRDDHIYIEDESGVAMVFRLVGKPIDSTNYWTIPVTHESGTVALTNTNKCFFRFLPTKNAESTRRTLYVPASAMVPRVTAGATAVTRELVNNDIAVDVYQFADASSEGVGFWHNFGNAWDGGTVRVQYHWTVQSGSNDIRWGIEGKSIADDEAIDTAIGTPVYTTDTIIAADDLHISALSSEVTVTGADAGEPVYFEIVRDGANVEDTSTATAELIGVTIEYNVIASYNGNVNTITFPAQSLVPRATNGATSNSRELITNDIVIDYLEFTGTAANQGAGLWLDLGNAWDAGSIRCKFHWTLQTSTGGTGVVWAVQGKSIEDDEAIDTAIGTQVSVLDDVTAVNDLHTSDYTPPITISGAGKGEPIYLEIVRLADDLSDTLTENAELISVTVEYTEALTPSMTTTEEIAFAISDETTDLAAATRVVTFRMPYAMVLKELRANVNSAPSGGAGIIVDVNVTDELASPDTYDTIMTNNKLKIDADTKTSTVSATPHVLTTTYIPDDAEITIDIDSVDATPGKGLKVWFIGYRA